MSGNHSKGLTLIELLVVISLISIFVTVAVPSFKSLIHTNRIQTAANELRSVLLYARSEAVSRGVSVTVKAPTTTDWTGGLTVSTVKTPVMSAEVLRRYDTAGLAATGTNTTGSVDTVVFRPNGTLEKVVTIQVCSASDSSSTGKLLTLSTSGNIVMSDFTPSSLATGCS
ncbi:type IV fimbrial biogenesis protein FimU [Pseudomonas duriflava]|uniref:Type II secretion system protein H n=1 Tax=Pseudomonas duriflava TaxID=459528 RepID=A0A562QDL7_9PSED|nr:GspH/FimT family pseudopilin [Pseudomonas duriflava]TWI54865.1 type IV fimbrial biogenesis protein FimU [Pseudomonas duriflava]